jgi:hypothetical protein
LVKETKGNHAVQEHKTPCSSLNVLYHPATLLVTVVADLASYLEIKAIP